MGIHNPDASGGGTSDHSALTNLDFAASGHTGDLPLISPTANAIGVSYKNSTTGTASTDGSFVGIASNGDLEIRQKENLPVRVFTNNTEKVTVLSNGNVGIGFNNPEYKAHIVVANDGVSGGAVIQGGSLVGNATALFFKGGTGGSSNYYIKGGLIWESSGVSNGRGSLHLAVDIVDDMFGVQVSDAKLTVHTNGYIGIGTRTPTTRLDVAGDARIGGTTNNVQFSSDGTLTLAGTARKTKNTWIPATSFHSVGGPSGATLVSAGLSFAMGYSASQDQMTSISFPLPLDMDITAPIQILIGKSNSVNTGNERWQVKYLYVGLGESAVNTTPDETLTQTVTVDATANGLTNLIFQTIVPTATDKMMHMQISRLGSDDLDTATGTSMVYGVMVLYTINKLGI